MPASSMARERLTYAVERFGKTASSNVYHLGWPSEFPLTLCGVIATETTARTEVRANRLGRDCTLCLEALRAGLAPVRDNPHRA